jgi:hypothetical protein
MYTPNDSVALGSASAGQSRYESPIPGRCASHMPRRLVLEAAGSRALSRGSRRGGTLVAMLGASLSTIEADSYGHTSSSFGLQLRSTNEPMLSLEWEVSEAGCCAQSCTPPSSLRATAVLICRTTFMDTVARCLEPCAQTHVQEGGPRARASSRLGRERRRRGESIGGGRKRRNRRPARALTCVSYAWTVARWKRGGGCR